MKCQIIFSGKSKKNIFNLASVELAQRVVNVNSGNRVIFLNSQTDYIIILSCIAVD